MTAPRPRLLWRLLPHLLFPQCGCNIQLNSYTFVSRRAHHNNGVELNLTRCRTSMTAASKSLQCSNDAHGGSTDAQDKSRIVQRASGWGTSAWCRMMMQDDETEDGWCCACSLLSRLGETSSARHPLSPLINSLPPSLNHSITHCVLSSGNDDRLIGLSHSLAPSEPQPPRAAHFDAHLASSHVAGWVRSLIRRSDWREKDWASFAFEVEGGGQLKLEYIIIPDNE